MSPNERSVIAAEPTQQGSSAAIAAEPLPQGGGISIAAETRLEGGGGSIAAEPLLQRGASIAVEPLLQRGASIAVEPLLQEGGSSSAGEPLVRGANATVGAATPRSRRKHAAPKTIAAMPLLQAVLVGIVAVFLIINGVRMTSAGIADFQTRAFLADWETKAAEPNQRAWNVALQAATRAAAHYPVANGAYLERLGYVHAWLHFRHPPGDPTARAQRIVARDAYRAAISARPAWPYAWAALAQIKLGLLEFDEEFHHALAQAHAMAPWRAEVNRRVAEVGLIAWPQLLHFEQTFVIIAAARAIQHAKRHRAPLFSFARNAGQIEALCAALSKQGYRPNANECPTRPPSTASP